MSTGSAGDSGAAAIVRAVRRGDATGFEPVLQLYELEACTKKIGHNSAGKKQVSLSARKVFQYTLRVSRKSEAQMEEQMLEVREQTVPHVNWRVACQRLFDIVMHLLTAAQKKEMHAESMHDKNGVELLQMMMVNHIRFVLIWLDTWNEDS